MMRADKSAKMMFTKM